MRQNVASVLTYMMRDPGLCEMFIWDLEAGLKELKTRLANNRRNPQPNFDLDCADKTELLEFLHSTVQLKQNPALGPKVLELNGRRFTGAEVMYVISWNLADTLVNYDGGGGDSKPPTPPPPPYGT